MKKIISICLFQCLFVFSLKAQLYVNSSGQTILGNQYFSQGFFTVSTNTGQSQSQLAFLKAEESSCALEVCNFTPESFVSTSDDVVGARLFVNSLQNRKNIGVQSTVYMSNSSLFAKTYGMLVSAGGAYYGYNFGICTSLSGTDNGTGIYASSGLYPDGVQMNSQYAGYFIGNVNVVGTLTATTVTQTSDYRLKENIRQLEGDNLSKLMDMNVVKYRFKNYEVNVDDTVKVPHYVFDNDNPLLKSDHYGLIAQELKEIYPELVVEDGDGYLSVNYTELIPILIKSVQELKAKVDELETNPDRVQIRGAEPTQLSQSAFPVTLYQNNPNPFTENTIVRCLIPKEVSSAVLYIYDMNGRQIDSAIITERGEVSLTIEGGSLDAGIYLYSLITDGVVVDTKRMLLTK
ncbi:MAG: tail fiber domain-containing protein [Bacteroidaceae bacterium]|nr:tail fiber domain-containing protein [Bacteroidaceae bacterium]MBO4560820.1 tail fiber domain-containing protein [Bacteroidaceae bacterium]